MRSTLTPYVDGWIGTEGKLISVIPDPRFPFDNNPINPDIWTREYDRDYEFRPRHYLPRMARRTSWTNLLSYSEDFTNVAWTATNVTATADVGIAPDGQETLGKLLETSATGLHSVSHAATVTAAAQEASVFAEGGLTRRLIRIAFTDSAATTFSAYFDLLSGLAVGASAGVTAAIIPLGLSLIGSQQYQCVIRFTPAAGAGTYAVNLATAVGTTSYAGNTAAGVYLWGAQVSAGTLAPYISTTSSTRTILAPDRDPVDPLAFLIHEAELNVLNSESGIVRKTFSRIPIQQSDPGSRWVKKPDLPGDFPQANGTSIIIKPADNVPQWIFFTQQVVSSDSGSSTGSLVAGAFTITYDGETTAPIAYSASAIAVAAALNALANIAAGDGVSVTGPVGGPFVVTFNGHASPTIDATNITTTAGSKSTNVFDNGVPGFFFGAVITGQPGVGVPNGGTFTITWFGQTTGPIAFNATNATVDAAVNALSEVADRGGISCANGGASSSASIFTGAFIQPSLLFNVFEAFTGDGADLVPAGSSVAVSNVGTTIPAGPLRNKQQIAITVPGATSVRNFGTLTPHGFSITDSLVIKIGTSFYTLPAGDFSLPDSSTVQITAAAGEAYTSTDSATYIGKATGSVYTADSKLTRILRITDFFVLGVTPGVDTIDDIPTPVYQGDPASLLQAIFAGSTEINIDVGELEVYKDGPIVSRTRTAINASLL